MQRRMEDGMKRYGRAHFTDIRATFQFKYFLDGFLFQE